MGNSLNCFPFSPALLLAEAAPGNGPLVVAYARTDQAPGQLWVWGTHAGRETQEPRLAGSYKSELHGYTLGHTFFIALGSDGKLTARGYDRNGCLGIGRCCQSILKNNGINISGSVVSVQHGRSHVLALTHDGQVYAWGANRAGQLGLGDVRPRFKPAVVESLKEHRVVQILAVGDASYAVVDTGTVYAWGDNAELAMERSEVFFPQPEVMARLQETDICSLEVRDGVIIAYIKDPVAEQMILRSPSKESLNSRRERQMSMTESCSSQGSDDAEEQHLVDFWCWGMWGNTRITVPFRPWVPRQLGVKSKQAVVAGKYFVALLATGEIYAWGMDNSGCLGLGDRKASASPMQLAFPAGAEPLVDIQGGNNHILALSDNGQIFAWGGNHSGQLGMNDYASRLQPTPLQAKGLQNQAVQILAFQDRSYALAKSGAVYAWGSNADNTLGVGEEISANVSEPTLVPRLDGIFVSRLGVHGLPQPALRPVRLD